MTQTRRRNGSIPSRLAIAGLCAFLGACSVPSLSTPVPPSTFDLSAPANYGELASRGTDLQIVVRQPTALRALETDRIMVKPSPEKISYYGKAVWSDRLPYLIQARLVQSLQTSGRYRGVASSREKMEPDLSISTDIRAFQIEVNGPASAAHVDLFVKIVDRSGRTVASNSFTARVPSNSDYVDAGVSALNQASQTVIRDISDWTARKTSGQASAPVGPLPTRLEQKQL